MDGVEIIPFDSSDQCVKRTSDGFPIGIDSIVEGQTEGKDEDRCQHCNEEVASFLVVRIPHPAAEADEECEHDPNPKVIKEETHRTGDSNGGIYHTPSGSSRE
jgi:hypothetical protein